MENFLILMEIQKISSKIIQNTGQIYIPPIQPLLCMSCWSQKMNYTNRNPRHVKKLTR